MKRARHLPAGSSLAKRRDEFDLCDSVSLPLGRRGVEPKALIVALFSSSPKWVDVLLALRNALVRRLGLKGGRGAVFNLEGPYEPGQRFGLFNLYSIDENEVVLGEDDKHLDFRISLYVQRGASVDDLSMSTLVKFRNGWGRLYFFFIKPFHHVIVGRMMQALVRYLNQEQSAMESGQGAQAESSE